MDEIGYEVIDPFTGEIHIFWFPVNDLADIPPGAVVYIS